MADRIMTQVKFWKALWTCPECKTEDVVEMNLAGGNEYVHTCSHCGKEFNQSCNNMRSFRGCVTYSKTEYDAKKSAEIETDKTALFNKWVYEIKNPPKYVEPTKEELEKMRDEKQSEIDELQTKIDAKSVAEK